MSDLVINWVTLDDVKSPAVSPVVVYGLLESIDSTIAEGSRVLITDYEDNVVGVLANNDDVIAWKRQNASWMPEDVLAELPVEEIEVEEIELEAGEPIDLDDDEFEEVKDKK
jgi:hypothetical protein